MQEINYRSLRRKIFGVHTIRIVSRSKRLKLKKCRSKEKVTGSESRSIASSLAKTYKDPTTIKGKKRNKKRRKIPEELAPSTIVPPEGHPLSAEKAKELVAGPYAQVCREIIKGCCAPIYWYPKGAENPEIKHNATITFIKTPKRLLGVTAAHVLEKYEADCKENQITLQIYNAVVDDLLDRVIARHDNLDLATFDIDEEFLNKLGKDITPVEGWPQEVPQEGRGIMIGGYPGRDRLEPNDCKVDFGFFSILGVARRVTNVQITWLLEQDYQVESADIDAPPENYHSGGVSGGPLIGWFETENHISYYRLSGIVTEEPDPEKSHFTVERLIAARADLIRENGTISGATI